MKRKHLHILLNILLGAFYLCTAYCMASFALFRLTAKDAFFVAGNALNPFWMFSPAPLLALAFPKRARYVPVAVYMVCAVVLVALTGGL